MMPDELEAREYVIVPGNSTLHRTLVKCRLHGAIADDGTRFWYSRPIVIIAESAGLGSGPGLVFNDEGLAHSLLQRIGQDADLESALYAVWAATPRMAWIHRANQLFEYLRDALPECFPDRSGNSR